MADVPATIATFTVDRLAFSLSPPVVAAIIDFDGGGRFQCELTDVDPATVQIGDRVVDDVPSPLHERRRAQLLLEGEAASRTRRARSTEHGITRDPRPRRHRRHGLHELRRALGQVDRRPAHRLVVGRAEVGRHRPRRRRRVLARHDGLGPVRPDAQPPAEDRPQAGHPRRELLRHRLRGVPQRLLRRGLGRLRRGHGHRRREAQGLRLLRASSCRHRPTTARPPRSRRRRRSACSPRPTPRSTASTPTR